MLSTVPIQVQHKPAFLPPPDVSLLAYSPLRRHTKCVLDWASREPKPPPFSSKIIILGDTELSFYGTKNSSGGRHICLRGSDGGFRRLDVKRGDAVRPAERLTEYSGQLTVKKAGGRIRGGWAHRGRCCITLLKPF